MYKVNVLIEGLAPLRMNRFTEESKANILSGLSVKKVSMEEKKKQAYFKAYKNEQGYFVPSYALESSFIGGGYRVKVGKARAGKDLKAILAIDPKEIPLIGNEPEFHEAVVRIPPGPKGIRTVSIWPYFQEWKLEFTITIIDSRFRPEVLRMCITEAGIYCGLLDGRPKWGRFALSKFEILENEA